MDGKHRRLVTRFLPELDCSTNVRCLMRSRREWRSGHEGEWLQLAESGSPATVGDRPSHHFVEPP
jgi:hypothetical protein